MAPVDRARVLVVDADVAAARALCRSLDAGGVPSHAAGAAHAVLDELESGSIEVVVAALGLDLVSTIRRRFPEVALVLLTLDAGVAEAVDAVTSGIAELLVQPVDDEELVFCVKKALTRVARASPQARNAERGTKILGEAPTMVQALGVASRAAAGDATVLVRGESGTGKELVARAIHDQSPRKAGPFVKIDCASLPETLLESELFGYEKGAFTGATSRKQGRVELADGGTLFLDEIAELSLALQVKFLRLLQDRQFERVGGTRTLGVDLRVVAATHRDLETMIEERQFRQDLFYRINVVPVWLPPLRARRDDIGLLARHFCAEFAAASGRASLGLDDGALRALRAERWPGNVRQLQNFVERLVVLCEKEQIGAEDVTSELRRHVPFATEHGSSSAVLQTPSATSGSETGSGLPVLPLDETLKSAERVALLHALGRARNNRRLAARLLGISRSNLYLKLAEHGLV